MLTAHWLNTIGLVLGIVGVLILFKWGPPQPGFEESASLEIPPETVLADGRKVADILAVTRRLKRRHECLSRLGLALIGAGFAAQLAAEWRDCIMKLATASS